MFRGLVFPFLLLSCFGVSFGYPIFVKWQKQGEGK